MLSYALHSCAIPKKRRLCTAASRRTRSSGTLFSPQARRSGADMLLNGSKMARHNLVQLAAGALLIAPKASWTRPLASPQCACQLQERNCSVNMLATVCAVMLATSASTSTFLVALEIVPVCHSVFVYDAMLPVLITRPPLDVALDAVNTECL